MKVIYWSSDKAREKAIAREFVRGVKANGDKAEIRQRGALELSGYDVAVVSGVKSMVIWQQLMDAKIPSVFVDQGYFKERKYHRVAINAHHPTWYIEKAKHDSERWKDFRINVKPWRESGQHIVIAGASEKYHQFYGLLHPTKYAKNLVNQIRSRTDMPIIYRPKPSWSKATPIEGTIYSTRKSQNYPNLFDTLRKAHVLITHGSNACFEAMIYGVPSIVLGDGIMRPISSSSLDDIEAPKLAGESARKQLLANLAWCQFSWGEFATGLAWRHLRSVICADRLLHL